MKHTQALAVVLALLATASPVTVKAADIWLDFSSAWVTELDAATTSAGVTNFTAGERSTIESNILSDIQTIYSSYQMTFIASAVDPGGTRERVNFGAVTGTAGLFGSAPVDFGNASTGTQSIFTANFNTFLEIGDTRAQQIAEISTSLAGTGAHELLHSLGARHHAAYGNLGITPANYAATGGLQNLHIMATGASGISETERETLRTLSAWSQVILDVAGGAALGSNIALTLSPVMRILESVDAGATAGTAQSIALQTGETSGRQIGFVLGDIDGSGADVDVYSFFAGVGTVTAELWSIDRFATDFDGTITLYDTDGATILFTNDDVRYSGDAFNSGTLHELDPFLLNIPIAAAGTYFLEVRAQTPGDLGFPANVGDDYYLLWDAIIPEPSRAMMLAVGFIGVLLRRRRHS